MAHQRDSSRPAAGAVSGGYAGWHPVDASAAVGDDGPLGVRKRFVGDAVAWALGAALVILLGAVSVAGYHLFSHEETVAAPLPAFSAEAAAWLAGQQEVAVYRDGHVYLYGAVATEAERQAMIAMATSVLGAGNVVADEYYVDPTVAPRAGVTTMRVADPVLFEFNSATIAPGFEPVLGFVAVLMQQNPSVNITVIGHTDDVGDENDNLRLSQERAQAGVAAIVARGGDGARLAAEGRGESQPIASNADEAGQRMNRRVEFVLTGL